MNLGKFFHRKMEVKKANAARIRRFQMEIGKLYNVVFSTGRYEIEYENNVKCIKKTPKSYRVERADGTTRLVGKDSVLELKEVSGLTDQ